ncbi:hypothetical protein BK659_24555 [Pseudomonas brassicacearum]|uniref:Uncharacterized protein n=1 Tax=Pseudomonas brassicacearum TaxID=930166 RepID=A0A423GVP9_9PSED|nr:hypothetical protein [Pseudomonas brassicacearum]RON01685.1 hypothetical protein BK659_24555 [Pseudomonas brassicacearum]
MNEDRTGSSEQYHENGRSPESYRWEHERKEAKRKEKEINDENERLDNDEKTINAEIEKRKNAHWKQFSQSNNEIRLLIFIHNNTSETIQLIDTDFDVEDMSGCDIPPYEIATMDAKKYFDSNRLSAVTARNQTFIKKFFTYGAGDMKCHFDTTMVVKSSFGVFTTTLTPTWAHQASSMGRKKLVCSSRLRAHVPAAPYSYCLDIHIGQEQ